MQKILTYRRLSQRALKKASKRRIVEGHHLEREEGIELEQRPKEGSIHIGICGKNKG